MSISCPACSTVAEPGARFCSNCGTSLQHDDELASQGQDLARYVPEEFLSKMRAARAGRAMEGERRTVTMLFADIKGSTAAAEKFDPEDWADIINGAFKHLIAPVYRYEGTLARLLGDAVLAFFGAPIAHEDDPVRALRAGLEITEAMARYQVEVRERWGIPVEVRVGVNTGLVVVGEVGSDLRVEYTAVGDAINVAARMEQTADPGTVRVTNHTLSLTGSAFDVEDLGLVEVKGRAEPVQTFRVVRFAGDGVEERHQAIVGRSEELHRLDELRSRLTDGAGWIASVIAEAGVGKSALLHEFRQRSAATGPLALGFDDPGEMSWMFGASRSYDAAIPFAAVRDLLRRWWGVDAGTDAFPRVEASVAALGLEDGSDTAALLGYIGGIPLPEAASAFIGALETPVLHAKAGEAFSSYLAATARQRPTMIVLEDLHWADDLSLALVDDVMELTEHAPVGLVFALRPYRDEPTWRVHEVAERHHHHRYHHIELAPLAAGDSRALLETLLQGVELPELTKGRILERSDGNPLFIEEMVRSLDEVGPDRTDAASIPTSLVGMLTARLDRLDEEAKFVVQIASVLGSEFRRDTLAAVLGSVVPDRQMTDLLRRGILVEAGRTPGTLGFRHALMQDAAYATILRRTRRDLHRRVADHLIGARPDAVEDIARHLVEAGEVQSAFPYLVEAGLRYSRSMALAEAIRHLGMAIDNAPEDADAGLVERAHAGLGEAYALVPDLTLAAAAYQRLYEFGEQAARPSARIAALNHLAYATASLGADLVRAGEYLESARRLAEETGDELGLAEYHLNACFVASPGGPIGKAAAHDEAVVVLGEKSGKDLIRLVGMVRRAVNYSALLDFEKAEPAIEAALQAAEASAADEAGAIVRAFGAAMVRLGKGDVRGFIEVADGAQGALERYSSFYAAMGQRNLGEALLQVGDLEGALGRFVDSRRIAAKLSQPFVAGAAAAAMAAVYATAGMVEPIPDLRAEALHAFERPLGELMASSAWADLGFADLALGEPARADSDFVNGLAAPSLTHYLDRPRLLAGRALALTLQEDFEGAGRALEEAVDFTRERGYTVFDALLGYVRGELLLGRERLEEAGAALTAAQQVAMERGQRMVLLQVLQARTRLALATGDTDGAADHAAAARGTIDAIAQSIADDALKAGFASTWRTSLDRITAERPS